MTRRCVAWVAGLLLFVSPLLALAAPAAASLAQVFKKVGGAVDVRGQVLLLASDVRWVPPGERPNGRARGKRQEARPDPAYGMYGSTLSCSAGSLRATMARAASVWLRLMASCGTSGGTNRKSPASLITDCFRPSP